MIKINQLKLLIFSQVNGFTIKFLTNGSYELHEINSCKFTNGIVMESGCAKITIINNINEILTTTMIATTQNIDTTLLVITATQKITEQTQQKITQASIQTTTQTIEKTIIQIMTQSTTQPIIQTISETITDTTTLLMIPTTLTITEQTKQTTTQTTKFWGF